jgi:hypothetical protein
VTALTALTIPILLSAVIVFVASSVIHMGPLWHRSDYPKVPNEDKLMDALRPLEIPPGDYMVPRPSAAEMRSPEFAAKVKRGPVMVVTFLPNEIQPMGRNLALWFVYCAVVSYFAAYIASRTLPPGADSARVIQLVGATAFIGYSLALWQMSIWYRRAWTMTVKATVDGLIYALLTAATFSWLWPR